MAKQKKKAKKTGETRQTAEASGTRTNQRGGNMNDVKDKVKAALKKINDEVKTVQSPEWEE